MHRWEGFFFGNTKHSALTRISNEEAGELIKKAYRDSYLMPGKLLRILQLLSILDIYKLARYALITKSM